MYNMTLPLPLTLDARCGYALRLAPPPTRNPGSPTAYRYNAKSEATISTSGEAYQLIVCRLVASCTEIWDPETFGICICFSIS